MVRKKTDEQKKAEEEKVYFGSITLLVPDELGIMKEMNGDIKLVNTLTKSKNPKRIKGQPSIILKEDKNITEAKLIESGVTVRQQRGLNKMKDTLERGKKENAKEIFSLKAKKMIDTNNRYKQVVDSYTQVEKELNEIDKKYTKEYFNKIKKEDMNKELGKLFKVLEDIIESQLYYGRYYDWMRQFNDKQNDKIDERIKELQKKAYELYGRDNKGGTLRKRAKKEDWKYTGYIETPKKVDEKKEVNKRKKK